MSKYCNKCKKMIDEKDFYRSNDTVKYPDGLLNICKKCMTMHVDNWNPDTYLWILEECDVPYIKSAWDGLLEKYGTGPKTSTGLTILGRYLAKMKLNQYRYCRYIDTKRLAEEEKEGKIKSLKKQGLTEEEIQEELDIDMTPPKPDFLTTKQQEVGISAYYDPELETDDFSEQLTKEDKTMLRLKWGSGYRAEEWIKLEQLYNDFVDSYDIQSAGHKDTLIMVCKASLKANLLMDAGDIDGAQKMTRVYNELMKSGNFQAVQNKIENGDCVDSVGELVALCEKEGFIPRYYVDGPKDKVDKTLKDLQHYTYTLVTEELNLGNMIESSLAQIMKDKERESKLNLDDSDDDDDDAEIKYREDNMLTDEEYTDYLETIEKEKTVDAEFLKGAG